MRFVFALLLVAAAAVGQSNFPTGPDGFPRDPNRTPTVDAPEPGSVVMMLTAGAVAAGFGLMRRRKT